MLGQLIQSIVEAPSLDAEYRFGQPKTYLTALEVARLTILRSNLGETCLQREMEVCRD
jgi:hypothetical protein